MDRRPVRQDIPMKNYSLTTQIKSQQHRCSILFFSSFHAMSIVKIFVYGTVLLPKCSKHSLFNIFIEFIADPDSGLFMTTKNKYACVKKIPIIVSKLFSFISRFLLKAPRVNLPFFRKCVKALRNCTVPK